MKIVKSLDLEKQEFIAPVLVPDEVDYHDHIYSEEEVYKACRNYRKNCNRANLQHAKDLSTDKAYFVEHYIAPTDMDFDNGMTVKKGTWMATMKFKDADLWQDVKDQKFRGFSISANCYSRKIQKGKIAGRAAAEAGHKAEKRLFDMDFSKEDHHVALVDEAANGTEVLVMKAKLTKQKEVNMTLEEKAAQEAIIKAKFETEAKATELQKAKELELEDLKKAKVVAEATAEELKVLKAKSAEDALELEELKKAKDLRETAEFVQKAKDLKADDADVFGTVLKKCKGALEASEFEVLEKQLGKLENIAKNKEVLDDLGQANAEKLVKSMDERIATRRAELIADGVPRHEASPKARQEVSAAVAAGK
jgi:hypothetical protein